MFIGLKHSLSYNNNCSNPAILLLNNTLYIVIERRDLRVPYSYPPSITRPRRGHI